MENQDKTLLENVNSSKSSLFATVIFLMFIFAVSIANSVFYIRIYNQSKERDSGTGIAGLGVKSSLAIGIISIVIGVVAFGWSLYLLNKNYKIGTAVESWIADKRRAWLDYRKRKMEKVAALQAEAALQESSLQTPMINRECYLPSQEEPLTDFQSMLEKAIAKGRIRDPTTIQRDAALNRLVLEERKAQEALRRAREAKGGDTLLYPNGPYGTYNGPFDM